MPSGTGVDSVTVLIVDDHPVLRHGLAAMLAAESWTAQITQAGTVSEGARLAVTERPDVAVVDLGLPDGSGVDLIRQIKRSVPDCAVVVLTMTDDASAVQACLGAGAVGYIRKDTAPQVVVRAVLTAAEGGVVLGPNVDAQALVRPEPADLPAPLNRLGARDLKLLRLLGDGRSNSEIARQLGVSEKTVRNRMSVIFSVLGVADRVQAALLAREKGLTAPRTK
jgi:DNA-binding NarL/FixJ family response regulator